MRALLASLLIVTAFPAAASAGQRVIAPPGNSGVNQYVEVIPTGRGGTPSSPPPSGGSRSGGSGGLAPATRRALAGRGSDGRGAAALAAATAPAPVPGRADGIHDTSRQGSRRPGPASGSSGASVSPLSTLGRALTGSSTHGGLSSSLPVILIVIALGAVALVLRRRRRVA